MLDKLIFKDIYYFNNKYYSYIYEYNDICIIIDINFIYNEGKEIFNYDKYCLMQNDYMYKYNNLYRFNYLNNKAELIHDINLILSGEILDNFEYNDLGGNREYFAVDSSASEYDFENIFIDTFGKDKINLLNKEVAISSNKNNYYIDFVLENKEGKIAFEINGITYHHPLLLGEESYKRQLFKQNLLSLLGYKIYRFSSNNLALKDKAIDNLKTYVKNINDYIPQSNITLERKFKLYEHQEKILENLDTDRLKSINTHLIVLPTGSGKSQIIIEDLAKNYIIKECNNILITVPNTRIKADWEARISNISYHNVDILCYSSLYKLINKINNTYYDYVVVDEAHHAPAATLKKAITYLKPKYLIGLTATPDRLDQKKLSEIFGNYKVNLSLKEAILKDILVDICCFRIKSNIDLSKIRFDGKDYNYNDLERSVVVESRNDLIVNTIIKYFRPKAEFRQGIIFCINKRHADIIASKLREHNIKAEAVYSNKKNNDLIFKEYENKEIQFLCSCQLIFEGFDSPQTEIIVMARPTLSKVLYMQQLGRGLRKYKNKKCLYLIDIVDNYGSVLIPQSAHKLFNIDYYVEGKTLIKNDNILIEGLNEYENKLEYLDFFTFEEKTKDYLSLEQAARELYINTSTLRNWMKKEDLSSFKLTLGNKEVPYFTLKDIENIRLKKGLKIHNDDTIYDDFYQFIKDNDLTFSYKLVFMINFLTLCNSEGEVNIKDLTIKYRDFYLDRLNNNLKVDRKNCPYTYLYLNDFKLIKKNMLANPFEKFERKRFLYLSNDLNIIAFNPILFNKLNKSDFVNILNILKDNLLNYYERLDENE